MQQIYYDVFRNRKAPMEDSGETVPVRCIFCTDYLFFSFFPRSLYIQVPK